jgi:hypothetical protein
MRETITKTDIANEIRMRLSSSSKTFVLVEGIIDKKFFLRSMDINCTQLYNCGGKIAVLDAFHVLSNDPKFLMDRMIAIVDVDEDAKLAQKQEHPHLFYTDSRDIDTMMLNSPAFDTLLSLNCDEDALEAFKQQLQGKDLRVLLLENALPLGYLRCLSKQEKYGFPFNSLQFRIFIDKKTLTLDFETLVEELNKHKCLKRDSAFWEMVKNQLEQLKSPEDDLWLICSGHDLLNILWIAMNHTWVKSKVKHINHDSIQDKLLHAYEYRFFKQTKLYEALHQWETEKEIPLFKKES